MTAPERAAKNSAALQVAIEPENPLDHRVNHSTALILNLTPNIEINAVDPLRCIEKVWFWMVLIYFDFGSENENRLWPYQIHGFQRTPPPPVH